MENRAFGGKLAHLNFADSRFCPQLQVADLLSYAWNYRLT